MKKKITYQIKIAFEKSRPECGVGKFLSPYLGSKGYEDSITFSKRMLRIDLKRSKLYTKEEILSNNRNSVYEQVQKSLLEYYTIATSFPQIKRCTLIIYKREKSSLILLIILVNELEFVLVGNYHYLLQILYVSYKMTQKDLHYGVSFLIGSLGCAAMMI